MVDEDLLKELKTAARKVGGVNQLPDEETAERITKLAETFIADRTIRWWWKSLTKTSQCISYDSEDGLPVLARLVEPKSEVILVVTDDNDPPWQAYVGSIEQIVKLLGECRFFEYFLTDPDGNWIIFDTHMNELVITGV